MDNTQLNIITLVESVYLFYMYFLFKTNFSFSSAIFDKHIQNSGSFFIHDTNSYENKICGFGKIMAIVAIILAFLRIPYLANKSDSIIYKIIMFDLICLSLAFLMNLNAFVYVIPIIICEIYIIYITSLR
jgi:hypothetical protein